MARKKKSKGSKRRKHMNLFKKLFKIAFWLSIPLLIIGTIYVLYLTKVISDRFYGRKWDLPSKVYSDSLILYPGLGYDKAKFESKLKRLEYSKSSSRKPAKGNYKVSGGEVIVYLQDFDYPREKFSGYPVKITFDEGKIISIEKFGVAEELYSVQLEPELIAEIFSKKMEERKVVRLKDVPKWFPNMIIAIEDRRFYEHFGLDWKSIARAFFANLKNMKIVQGGSTITQQLVRNFFLTQKQTFGRKLHEALMSVILEVLHTKEEILEAYMNEVWMGQKGSVSVHGFGEAARFYFGKDLKYIHPIEGAMLVGMIRSAYYYSPYKFYDKSLKRAKLIIDKCYESEVISPKQRFEALSERPEVKEFYSWVNKAPYFISFIRKQLLELYPEDMITTGGLRIFTTLDMDTQLYAQKAVSDGLTEIDRDYKNLRRKDPEQRLQASFIAVKPQTGYIKAYVGGRDFKETQFDRISMSKRQPGSLFKPFVYLTAFELSADGGKYTPSSILEDAELVLKYDGRVYKPENYEQKYFGTVTFRTALERSLNSATVRLGHEIGEKKIVEMTKDLGFESKIEPYPSVALGSFEVTPLEMVQAYAVIANMGTKATLLSIKDVINDDGAVLEKKTMQLERKIKAQYAYMVNHILEGVFDHGTAQVSRIWGYKGKGAGKTGTTDDYRDSWFVGYTPELLSVAWIGFDNNESTTLSGAAGGLRIWTKFMKNLPEDEYSIDFRVPDNIEFADVDRASGLIAGSGCKDVVREAFIKGTRPKERQSCK